MTFGDHESLDDDVILALRADGKSGVPAAARERVARRLGLAAGVIGAGSTVAGGAGAIATAGITTHSTALLVSTLAVGIGIGFGARSGVEALKTPPAAVSGAVSRAHAPAPSVQTPTPAASHSALISPLVSGSVAALPARPAEAPSARVPSRAATARDSPVPNAAPAPVLQVPGLAAQQWLLDEARSALARNDGTSALSAIGAHRLRFPDTALVEERAALEIRALLSVGRVEEARERHAVFEHTFPGSLFAPSLRRLLPSATADIERNR